MTLIADFWSWLGDHPFANWSGIERLGSRNVQLIFLEMFTGRRIVTYVVQASIN